MKTTLEVSEADKKKFKALKKQSKTNKAFADVIFEEFYRRIGTLPETEVDPPQVTSLTPLTSFFTPKPAKKKEGAAANVTPDE